MAMLILAAETLHHALRAATRMHKIHNEEERKRCSGAAMVGVKLLQQSRVSSYMNYSKNQRQQTLGLQPKW